MDYKYQLILLGTLDTTAEKIINGFYATVDELKLLKNSFKIIKAENVQTEYSGNQPAFVIYLGDRNGFFRDVATVDSLMKEGVPVLPIFYQSFGKEIPKVLENQNGLLYDDTRDEKIINLALEFFGKLRNTRKVFISYKRYESSSVAIQLYEALEKNNFDVFLDTHSIKQGEPFQEELWHRMTDCDVIVLLNTPGFMTSRWCKEEVAEASAKQIGVIQLVWPNHKLESTSEISFPIQLQPSHFVAERFDNKDNSKLEATFVNELVSKVEAVRARNLASRQDSLITEFVTIAAKNGKRINLQPERFLTEDLPDNKRRIFIPLVGIPQSIDCNQSAELKKEIEDFDVSEVHLIYDDVRIREKWIKHLDWLNNYLDVQTIKKQDFSPWLQKN